MPVDVNNTIKVFTETNFAETKVIVDTDLNVYKDNILRRLVVLITSLFSNRYDHEEVSQKISEFFLKNKDKITYSDSLVKNLEEVKTKFTKENSQNPVKQAVIARCFNQIPVISQTPAPAKEEPAPVVAEAPVPAIDEPAGEQPKPEKTKEVETPKTAPASKEKPSKPATPSPVAPKKVAPPVVAKPTFISTIKTKVAEANLVKKAAAVTAMALAGGASLYMGKDLLADPKSLLGVSILAAIGHGLFTSSEDAESVDASFGKGVIYALGAFGALTATDYATAKLQGTWVVVASCVGALFSTYMGMTAPLDYVNRNLVSQFFSKEDLLALPIRKPHFWSRVAIAAVKGFGWSPTVQKSAGLAADVLAVAYFAQGTSKEDTFKLAGWTALPYAVSYVAVPLALLAMKKSYEYMTTTKKKEAKPAASEVAEDVA